MTFEQAMAAMRAGKTVRVPGDNYYRLVQGKLFYEQTERGPWTLSAAINSDLLVAETWEIVG